MKGVGHVLKLEGEKSLAAGGLSQHLQAAIALVRVVAEIGADGIDNHARSLGHLNGFLAQYAALVVISIGNQDDCPAHRTVFLFLHQLVPAGIKHGVPQRSAAARTDDPDSLGQLVQVVGEILGQVPDFIKGQNKGLISLGPDNLVEKRNRRVLLKQEAVADGVAGVNQQAHAQRQIGLCGKIQNLAGRTVVVQNLELVLLQVPDELVVLVRYREDYVHLV